MKTRCYVTNWGTLMGTRDRMNYNPDYQRGPAWPLHKKRFFIDSVLQNMQCGQFWFHEREEDGHLVSDVVDGQQRLRALEDFQNNRFKTFNRPVDGIHWEGYEKTGGKTYAELPTNYQQRFQEFSINKQIIEDATDTDVRRQFLRLNEDSTLNPQEKRNAMIGCVRDFVKTEAENNVFFKGIRYSSNRYKHDDLMALMTRIGIENGPASVGAKELKHMYSNNSDFKPTNNSAKKILKGLNRLRKVCAKHDWEATGNKWPLLDLFLLVIQIEEEYCIDQSVMDALGDFFVDFEAKRKMTMANETEKDLLSSGIAVDAYMYQYIKNFETAGAKKKAISLRNQSYKICFLESYSGLVPKDSRRRFSADEKEILWHRSNHECVTCERKIDLGDVHADHIKPHSRGGQTILSNGQALCATCNYIKGSNFVQAA